MRYCTRCVIPSTRPHITFDEHGVCNACRAFEARPSVDWSAREAQLGKFFEQAKASSARYDCLVPVSGGKDSTWQVATCLRYGMRPLAVTWRPPARTEVGEQNLQNLIALGVDHIDYRIDPNVEKRFMIESLKRFGTPAIPMHMAIFSIPLRLAVALRIPLVVWGENSAAEYGGSAEEQKLIELNEAWVKKFGVTHGTTAQDWISEQLSEKDLSGYFAPSDAELAAAHVKAIFLGQFIAWDPIRVFEEAKRLGFVAEKGGARTGLYDFADIDDDFISIHHYIKWYKFGFTRLFDNLSLEIRNGRLTRSDAIDVIRRSGSQVPTEDIETFCKYTGLTNAEFFEILETFRNKAVWSYVNGRWEIPGFIVGDWQWQ